MFCKAKKSSAAGFEPARASPLDFETNSLNHSDILTDVSVPGKFFNNLGKSINKIIS